MIATVHNGDVALVDDLFPGIHRWIVEQAPVALSILDLDGNQILNNLAFRELMGVGDAEDPTSVIRRITRTADHSWTTGYLARLASGELGEYRTEKVYQRPDGTEVHCTLLARPLLREDEVVGIVGVIEPVHERPVVSDERMRKMIENIDDTVSLIDETGRLLDTSGRYRATLGYPKEFWATRTIFDLLHPDDAMRVLAMREEVLSEPGRHVSGEYQVLNADGGYEDIEVHAVNLLDDPEVGGIVITSRNITTRKAIMREIALRRDEAIAQADLRTRLIATVSHELRNPLHAMSGLSELLATSNLPTHLDDLASTLHRQILGLTRVIDDLLETSRLDIGVIDVRAEPMVLRGLVDDIVMLGRSLAEGRAVDVSASIARTVPPAISADPARLRQVLGNLVGNAVKFTDTGHVQLRVHTEGDEVVFEVVDTGRGIPPDELSHVFEPFSTASTGGTRVGAGLGLSIVRQIVELMGGSTSVTSHVDQGSAFSVRIPLVACDLPEGAIEDSEVATIHVLVVEDNPVNQMLARNQLERLGMTPVIVGSGEEAIALLGPGEGPYVVLMDHQLPGMDGLECTRMIRDMESDGRPRSVIIGVTASAMAADRDACLIGGMDDFLAKPVSLQDLGATLQRWSAATHGHQPDHASRVADEATDAPSPGMRHDDAHEPARPETDMNDVADTEGHDEAGQTLDQSTLVRLGDELGGLEVVGLLASTYLDELPQRTTALLDAAEAGDLTAASRAAHTLKSSSRLLGGHGLGDLCQETEHATTIEDARVLVPRVVAVAAQFAGELRAWMASAG